MCIIVSCSVQSAHSLPVPDKSVPLPSTGATSVHLLVTQWNCLRGEAIMLPLTCLVHCLWLWEEQINMIFWMTCGCVIPPPSCGKRYCFLRGGGFQWQKLRPRPVFYIALLPTHPRVILRHIMIFIIFSSLIFIKRLLLDARSTSQQHHNDIHNDIHNI